VDVVAVTSAADLQAAMGRAAAQADAVVMAAAVADYRPADPATAKIKKDAHSGPPTIQLAENPDILMGLVAERRGEQVIVGFAAETGDERGSVLDHGLAKLRRKGCDLIIINPVGEDVGFGTPDNQATIAAADGTRVDVPRSSKEALAHAVWDEVVARLP